MFKMMLSGLDLLFTADYLVGFCPCRDRWGRWCCPVQWTPRRGTGIRLHSSHPPLFDLLCTRHQPLTHLDSHLSVWPSGTGTCPSLQLSVHNTRQHAVRGTVVFLGAAGYADEPHTTEPHSHFNLKPSLDGILEPFTWTGVLSMTRISYQTREIFCCGFTFFYSPPCQYFQPSAAVTHHSAGLEPSLVVFILNFKSLLKVFFMDTDTVFVA